MSVINQLFREGSESFFSNRCLPSLRLKALALTHSAPSIHKTVSQTDAFVYFCVVCHNLEYTSRFKFNNIQCRLAASLPDTRLDTRTRIINFSFIIIRHVQPCSRRPLSPSHLTVDGRRAPVACIFSVNKKTINFTPVYLQTPSLQTKANF